MVQYNPESRITSEVRGADNDSDEWAQATMNEMKGCKLSNVTALVQEKQKELPRYINKKKKKVRKEMNMIFKGSIMKY